MSQLLDLVQDNYIFSEVWAGDPGTDYKGVPSPKESQAKSNHESWLAPGSSSAWGSDPLFFSCAGFDRSWRNLIPISFSTSLGKAWRQSVPVQQEVVPEACPPLLYRSKAVTTR